MGLPPTWIWSLGGTVGVNRQASNEATFYGHFSLYRDIANPATTIAGMMFDGYFGRRGTAGAWDEGFDGGVRAGLYFPAVRLGFQADYNARDEQTDLLVSLIHPVKRGGILTNGGSLRIDWWPTRGHSTAIGIQLPVGAPFIGTSRPREDHVELRDPTPPVVAYTPSAELERVSAAMHEVGIWIDRTTVPFTDQWDGDKDRALEMYMEEMSVISAHLAGQGEWHYPGERTPQLDTELFHDLLATAFGIAIDGRDTPNTPRGRRISERAREIVLDEVLLPYNQLIGRKRRPDSTTGFGTAASAAFYEWIATSGVVPLDRRQAVAWVFADYLAAIEEVRTFAHERWEDSRFVWLPYQLALTPDQHDEQDELNALIERGTQREFTAGNRIWYVENEQFQAELQRMILAARDYHIIWIHDFRGYDVQGDPDEMAFRQVTESYLPALISAVERYDETGKIPQYLMILDQFYFQENGGKLWANLLQDPMRHRVRLPGGFEMWEDSISSLQTQLRTAVEQSDLLQAQAAQFESGWIENLVKVHVNITQPADNTFWTREMFPRMMGLPDVIMRDHRKISMYDISEADPYSGQALYTGMGVGEHYIGAGWEDRAVLAEGPALLGVRNAAQQVLINQGFQMEELPWELQAKPFAEDYWTRVDALREERGDFGQMVDLHNQIGFRPKDVSIFKATLYTLLPAGSVIKAPDSIWGSPLWGSMMLGLALRGGRSLVIAPAIDNAPSDGFPQMSRAQELMTRLVVADQMVGDQIGERGGLMKVGLYATDLDVGNVPGKITAVLDNAEATPWLSELWGFTDGTTAALRSERDRLIASGFERRYTVPQERKRAKLHLKAHFFATARGWELPSQEGFGALMTAFFGELAEQNVALSNDQYRDIRLTTDALRQPAIDLIDQWLGSLDAAQEAEIGAFLAIGSHNQNTRSAVLDGEVALVTAGLQSYVGLPDFIVLAGLSTWIDDLETLEELFPGYDGLQRRISRFIRIAVQ